MAISNAHALFEKIQTLPDEKVTEVEDFVDFLRHKLEEQTLTRAVAKISETAFAKIWDNPDDAAYDRI